MKRIFFTMLLLMLCFSFPVFSQSSTRISELLETKTVTYGQFSYLVATMLGLKNDSASYDEAFNALLNEGYMVQDAAASDAVDTEGAAFICAKVWNVHNSVLYMLFPSKRYALRMLRSMELIPEAFEPTKTLSGREVLNLFSACIEKFEGVES